MERLGRPMGSFGRSLNGLTGLPPKGQAFKEFGLAGLRDDVCSPEAI